MKVFATQDTPMGKIELVRIQRGEDVLDSFDDLPHGTLRIVDDRAEHHTLVVRVSSNGEPPQKFDGKTLRNLQADNMSLLVDQLTTSLVLDGRGIQEYSLVLNGELAQNVGAAVDTQFRIAHSRATSYPYVSVRMYQGRYEKRPGVSSQPAVSVTLKSGATVHFGEKLYAAGSKHIGPINGIAKIFGQEMPFSVQYKAWPEFYFFVSQVAVEKLLEDVRDSSPILDRVTGWKGGLDSWEYDFFDSTMK